MKDYLNFINESLIGVKPGDDYEAKEDYKERFIKGKKYKVLDINDEGRPLVRDEETKHFRMKPETFEKIFDIESPNKEKNDAAQFEDEFSEKPKLSPDGRKLVYYWLGIYEDSNGNKVHGEWKRFPDELEIEKKEYIEKGYREVENISIERKHVHMYAAENKISMDDILKAIADNKLN